MHQQKVLRPHDHAWRLVSDAPRRPSDGRFKVYRCDLCPAIWTT
jgi:hypothetical protein